MNEVLEQYIKESLRIKWIQENDNLYIGLTLNNKVISKIPFEQY